MPQQIPCPACCGDVSDDCPLCEGTDSAPLDEALAYMRDANS